MNRTCPECFCGGDSSCIDSRCNPSYRRRRYQCGVCGLRFTTIEVRCDEPPGKGEDALKHMLLELVGDEPKTRQLLKEVRAVLDRYEPKQ